MVDPAKTRAFNEETQETCTGGHTKLQTIQRRANSLDWRIAVSTRPEGSKDVGCVWMEKTTPTLRWTSLEANRRDKGYAGVNSRGCTNESQKNGRVRKCR